MIKKSITYLEKVYSCFKGYSKLCLKDRSLTPIFYVSTRIEAEKILKKDNEADLLETFLAEIQPGDIVFDIGANIGLYTLPSALKLGGTGSVHAFEPVPLWFQRLQENIQLNVPLNQPDSMKHVFTYNIGLSDKDETRELVMKGIQGSGMGGITGNYRDHLSRDKAVVIPVMLVRGDDFLLKKKIPGPNIVKIDVEGAEFAVLQGLNKALQHSTCRFILCEVHPQFMSEAPGDVEKLLGEYGFDIQVSGLRRTEYHIIARKITNSFRCFSGQSPG